MSKQKQILKIALPLLLGVAIFCWMYRGFDFQQVGDMLLHDMSWTWMLLSLPFGVMAQVLRGWRWRLTLDPMGEHARSSVAVNAIFLSYATSLVIPRVGEFTRCGVLKRWDGVSFPKALGTVVTERVVDVILLLFIIALALALEMSTFGTFFEKTGTSFRGILSGFSWAGYLVAAVCAVAIGVLFYILVRHLSIYNKVKATIASLREGVSSVRRVKSMPAFLAMTVGIWLCYFLHYYLTFYCFGFTANLGLAAGLVTFIAGSMAVIVPTPNGLGPWHVAVSTMLILYGVDDAQASGYVLIVHAVQTLLIALLGLYAWLRLSLISRCELRKTQQ